MVTPKTNLMSGVNPYGKELAKEEIDKKLHRDFVGGLWEELGQLQYDFLKSQGLKPFHKLLDIGCGCLRGGLHFIKYLEEGNYYGLDINSSLIQAGILEIEEAGLEDKHPRLLVDDQFRLDNFREDFDFIVSISLFTHLPMNIIIRCLSEVRKHLKSGGVYFSTFFEAPKSAYLDKLTHHPGEIITNYDSDPFHYSFQELSWMASTSRLEIKLIGDWNHPRNQKMAAFFIKQ
jgi:cyclopropane fatty-acyl-phospholipid synthase-like methyltransferase